MVVDELLGLLLQAAARNATGQIATATRTLPETSHCTCNLQLLSDLPRIVRRRPVTGVSGQSPARSLSAASRTAPVVYRIMGHTIDPAAVCPPTSPSLEPMLPTVRRPPTWLEAERGLPCATVVSFAVTVVAVTLIVP